MKEDSLLMMMEGVLSDIKSQTINYYINIRRKTKSGLSTKVHHLREDDGLDRNRAVGIKEDQRWLIFESVPVWNNIEVFVIGGYLCL